MGKTSLKMLRIEAPCSPAMAGQGMRLLQNSSPVEDVPRYLFYARSSRQQHCLLKLVLHLIQQKSNALPPVAESAHDQRSADVDRISPQRKVLEHIGTAPDAAIGKDRDLPAHPVNDPGKDFGRSRREIQDPATMV